MKLNVLAVIPARGGSKGLPGKNLMKLGRLPLMEYTARAARAARKVDRLVVSTDDESIAVLARSLGLEVPFERPPELAGDGTHMKDVMQHALAWFSEHEAIEYEAVVCLDITAPFKLGSDIDRSIEALENGATSTGSVCEAEINPYFNMLVSDGELWARPLFEEYFTLARRQEAPVVYRENAIVQAVLASELRRGVWPLTDKCKLIVIPQERSIMIDREIDFVVAEALHERFLNGEFGK
jgi:N-acylneuraminate cytidylyltransferase/CMP-N,N'-diacetyllegionaminic acid synthase